MNENSKIRRVLKYFFRDELDVRHKITNVTARTSIFLMLVSLIGSVIIKKPFANTVLTLIIVTIFGLLLLGLNRHPNAMWNIFALCAVEVFLVAPFFYFSCGGKECDMCFTMILCMLFCVVLLRGFWRFLMFFMSVLMYGTCVILEYFNPHWVYQYESVVIIIAFKLFYFVTMGAVMAFAIAYQAKKYEEEHAYLKEKEAQL
ncbi:MAG: hypothetical protein IK068_01760, partial [Lachnospiraceae bacterium]|nr:hypothetical protein [Lachnospiraceae bacterium]